MNLKKELYEASEPPAPKGRDAFLKALPYPKLTYPEFIFSQIGYIRKRMWAVSAAVLLAGICSMYIIPNRSALVLWVISSLAPFLAVFTAAEISRSSIFGMSEIEAGCRFALPQLTGARMLILGVCNFTVISVGTLISGIFSPFGIALSALYILTPYVCVCGASLAVFGKVRGQDGVYISGGIALAVSVFGIVLFSENRLQSSAQIANLSEILLCAAGTALTIVQIKKILVGKDIYYGTEN